MIHDNPPLIGIAMRRTHYINKVVKQNECFSVNIPTSDMVIATDYCGLHSGTKIDKSKEFELFYGKLQKAPMINQCCINIECKLVNTIEFKYNDFFIGEIVEIYCDEKYVNNRKPNAKVFDSFICLMPNGPYFKLGDYLAEAYEVGTSYKPKK
jgi:flavin reductase (DIM6/NTAB) family NADH-FMN oxidoreductase RutF